MAEWCVCVSQTETERWEKKGAGYGHWVCAGEKAVGIVGRVCGEDGELWPESGIKRVWQLDLGLKGGPT